MLADIHFSDTVHPERLKNMRLLSAEHIKAMSGLNATLSMMQGSYAPEISAAQLLNAKMAKGIDAYLKCNIAPFTFQDLHSFKIDSGLCDAALIDLAAPDRDHDDIAIILPSFINSGSIFSAGDEHSFASYLSENKIHPFVFDWNINAKAHDVHVLSNYIHDVLWPLMHDFLCDRNCKIHLIGYCFGGVILALFLSLYGHKIHQRITASYLATPWQVQLDSLLGNFPMHGDVKAETLQGYFTSLKPAQIMEKYAAFSDLVEAYSSAIHNNERSKAQKYRDQIYKFVAVEDWLLGGEDIPNALFQSFFSDRQKEGFSHWGDPRTQQSFNAHHFADIPSLHVLAYNDHLVPHDSSLSLFNVVEDQHKKILYFEGGHIGLMASGRAKSGVWDDIVKFMLES